MAGKSNAGVIEARVAFLPVVQQRTRCRPKRES